MATHQLAQGLASLGRHGDSMLMHVSPSEVAQQTLDHLGMGENVFIETVVRRMRPRLLRWLAGSTGSAVTCFLAHTLSRECFMRFYPARLSVCNGGRISSG